MTYNRRNLFMDLVDHAETFGELPENYEGLGKDIYLQMLTEKNKSELDGIISDYAEAAWENRLNDFYGSSSPQTLDEIHKKAFDTKQKLR